jgi:hypothetical protein
MDIINLVIGFLMFFLGVIIIVLILGSKDKAIVDKYGANMKIYSGAIMFILGGIYLILKEIFM